MGNSGLVEKGLMGPTKVAVEFTRPAPSFWRIAYPPTDWTASIVWYFFKFKSTLYKRKKDHDW